ncbi:SRPBCC domain-containing protein [Azospirillaceae bacterium]
MSELLDATVEIAASAERVWGVLCDFVSYPEWNPFITSVEGKIRRGARLTIHIATPGHPAIAIHTRLLKVRRGRELSWRGQVLAPGMLDGEHSFVIEPLAAERCRVRQQAAHFSGVLAPMLLPGLLENTRRGFEAMNLALKQRAENSFPIVFNDTSTEKSAAPTTNRP